MISKNKDTNTHTQKEKEKINPFTMRFQTKLMSLVSEGLDSERSARNSREKYRHLMKTDHLKQLGVLKDYLESIKERHGSHKKIKTSLWYDITNQYENEAYLIIIV